MTRILYIGGFELPDKNAAAQRVVSIGKAFREIGYQVMFHGITKSDDCDGKFDGFCYDAVPYPKTTLEWIKYALGYNVVSYIDRVNPNCVILYNYPAIAQERIIRYCRKRKMRVLGDITEWYQPSSILKRIEVGLRMRWSNKHLDGIISISRYLNDFYKKHNSIMIPPLVDKSEMKWIPTQQDQGNNTQVRLCYVGSPGGGKDRLDYIVSGIKSCKNGTISLDVIGITKEQYNTLYGEEKDINNLPVVFWGRLPHNEAINKLKESDFQIFFRENTVVNNAGFPTKYVESVSAGIPVITNKTSNLSDFLITGKNGFLIDDTSAGSIAKILIIVSNLSKKDILTMKQNVDSSLFDYHNFVALIASFSNKLGINA